MTEDITWDSSTDSERGLSKPTRTSESLPRMDPQKQSKHYVIENNWKRAEGKPGNKGTLKRKETRKLNQKANGTNLKMKSKTRSKNQVVPRRGSSQQEIRP